jgi:ectoine hydroxylase-related dioxygenase (phytanoyl-CoA dioxygenase family)
VGSAAGWHQDAQAWPFFVPHNHVSCWVALDDATLENGCMRVIKGSHQFGIIERTRIPNFLTSEEMANEAAVPLPAGSCMFHHGLTLHSSHANKSPYRRRGLALHYIQSRTRYIGGEGDPPNNWMLIRGQEFPGCV